MAATIIAGAVATDGDAMNTVTAALRIEVDSRAMRKLEVSQTVYCCLEVLEIGTATMSWAFNSRQLVKLP